MNMLLLKKRSLQTLANKVTVLWELRAKQYEDLFNKWYTEVKKLGKVWGLDASNEPVIICTSDGGYNRGDTSDPEDFVSILPDTDLPLYMNEPLYAEHIKERFARRAKQIPKRQDLVDLYLSYETRSSHVCTVLGIYEELFCESVRKQYDEVLCTRLRSGYMFKKLFTLEVDGREFHFIKDNMGWELVPPSEYAKEVL